MLVKFHNDTPQLKIIEEKLYERGIEEIPLDHFALIDLPGPHTGISELAQIFSAMGYIVQGTDYLPDKQNDFLWLTEIDSKHSLALKVLPQVVVADFRLDEMPTHVRKIISKYSKQASPSPLRQIQKLTGRVYLDDFHAAKELNDIIMHYLNGRDWPLPNKQEFYDVYEFNQLLAWVLLFGRRPNHFTIATHLLNGFENLRAFLQFIEDKVQLKLNYDGGLIKGNVQDGMEQGSTTGIEQRITLADGEVTVLSEFVEFIWRFPHVKKDTGFLWQDYHTGFIPQNANRVIESLYVPEKEDVVEV